jgi:quercetin dioxygenase-like cupin family protein
MAAFQAFELTDLQNRQAKLEKPYQEFLRRPGVSLGLYMLSAGGTDLQHPHDADEIYVVLAGQANLVVEGTVHKVTTGSVVSVDRGREHRFVDIADDLHVLVIFAPPESPES